MNPERWEGSRGLQEAIQWKGLLAYVLVLPVMVVKGLPAVGHTIQLSDVVFLVPCLAWAWALRRRDRGVIGTPLLGAMSALVGIAVLSVLASGVVWRSGLHVVGLAYTALVYLLIVNTVRTWAQWSRLITIWVVVSTVVASLGIFGVLLGRSGIGTPFATLHPPLYHVGDLQRPFWVATSTFWASPTPNMVYGYFHVGVFLAMGLSCRAATWPQRLGRLGSVGIHVVAIALSYSRGWSALVLGLIVFLRQFRSHLAMAVSHALFLVFVLLTAFIQVISSYNIRDVSVTVRDADPGPSRVEYPYLHSDVPVKQLRVEATVAPFTRPYLRDAALRMARQHPWRGVGPGRFSQELHQRQVGEGERWGGLRVQAPWDPHSTYFGAVAELGWPGLLVVLALFGLAVRQALEALRACPPDHTPLVWAVFGCLIGYLLFALDEDLLTKRWLWCVLGLAGSAWALSRTPVRSTCRFR